MKKNLTAILLAVASVAALPARAVDSVSAELGRGEGELNVWRLGMQWNHEPRFLEGSDWRLYWDASLGGWQAEGRNVNDLGLTPTFRYAPHRKTFVEAAIGFHLVSDVHIRHDQSISTRFQFGDHVGVGYDFGRYDVSVRLQHLSNGGIRQPNPGINFLLLRLQWHLR